MPKCVHPLTSALLILLHCFTFLHYAADCNIKGQIPVELPWGFEKLKSLDLSNNELIGHIPSELELFTHLGKILFYDIMNE